MIQVLEFIFQDFWHWLGTLILLIALLPWNTIPSSHVHTHKRKKKITQQGGIMDV